MIFVKIWKKHLTTIFVIRMLRIFHLSFFITFSIVITLDIRKSVYSIFWFGIKNEVTDIVPLLKEAAVSEYLC